MYVTAKKGREKESERKVGLAALLLVVREITPAKREKKYSQVSLRTRVKRSSIKFFARNLTNQHRRLGEEREEGREKNQRFVASLRIATAAAQESAGSLSDAPLTFLKGQIK